MAAGGALTYPPEMSEPSFWIL